MAKIIIFGDIDISPLYVTVNGQNEIKISSKKPVGITVPNGAVSVCATTLSKLQRGAMSVSSGGAFGAAADAFTASINDYIEGEVELEANEYLLIQVKQKGVKTQVLNKVVSKEEVDKYINLSDVVEYGEKASGQKNKWTVFFLCFFFGAFGVHRFYEKKIGTGILWLLTFGLFGFGYIVDLLTILFRKN